MVDTCLLGWEKAITSQHREFLVVAGWPLTPQVASITSVSQCSFSKSREFPRGPEMGLDLLQKDRNY